MNSGPIKAFTASAWVPCCIAGTASADSHSETVYKRSPARPVTALINPGVWSSSMSTWRLRSDTRWASTSDPTESAVRLTTAGSAVLPVLVCTEVPKVNGPMA